MDLKALYSLSYGVYLVTSKHKERINGQIANTVFQVSSDPATIAISINKQNLTHEFIQNSRLFAISILPEETPLPFIGQFGFKSGRDTDKFAVIDYQATTHGLPYLEDEAIAYIEAKVIQDVDAGTHTIFIGEIIGAEVLRKSTPMTYAYYHQVKRGSTPPSAPTYVKADKTERSISMGDKYECAICGYIYDPKAGDPDNDVAPGTTFENLPDDWVCPVCGASKDVFEKVG